MFLDNQQELRLQTAETLLLKLKAKTVLDLGCGKGDLIARLRNNPHFEKIVGVDASGQILKMAKEILALPTDSSRISLLHRCITELENEHTDTVCMYYSAYTFKKRKPYTSYLTFRAIDSYASSS